MTKVMTTRALRDTVELQSAAAKFFSKLAQQAKDPLTRKLLTDFAQVEQMLVLEVEAMAKELCEAPLPHRASPRVARIKTAPEWSAFSFITGEQALAVALDCTRRAFRHHSGMVLRFDGPVADFFLRLAQDDEDRAAMLEKALDQRLAELVSGYSIHQVLVQTLQAVRHAGKTYEWLAKRTTRGRTIEFLKGMVEVCSLHAGNIQRLAGDAMVPDDEAWAFEGLVAATAPCLDGNVEDLDFESAMRMAMNAQKRAALVHGMQARAYRGHGGKMLLDIAEAERRHAATIASVLDRLAPQDDDTQVDVFQPLENAPRESWTCPAPPTTQVVEPEETDDHAPSLRLVAGVSGDR